MPDCRSLGTWSGATRPRGGLLGGLDEGSQYDVTYVRWSHSPGAPIVACYSSRWCTGGSVGRPDGSTLAADQFAWSRPRLDDDGGQKLGR